MGGELEVGVLRKDALHCLKYLHGDNCSSMPQTPPKQHQHSRLGPGMLARGEVTALTQQAVPAQQKTDRGLQEMPNPGGCWAVATERVVGSSQSASNISMQVPVSVQERMRQAASAQQALASDLDKGEACTLEMAAASARATKQAAGNANTTSSGLWNAGKCSQLGCRPLHTVSWSSPHLRARSQEDKATCIVRRAGSQQHC